jgi:Ca2+-binding RTX toxin-like protein
MLDSVTLSCGNASNNTMVGNAGNNSLTAGSGNDTINAGSGNDNLLGGNGTDTLNGGNGADFLDGGNGIDLLNGGDGNDNLCGGLGNDNLIGGTGSDTLTGGAGVDTLNGGAGRDNFVFDSRAFEDRDIIADFNVADDQIGLRSSIVTEVGGTVSAAEFVNVTSGGATNADQRLIYNSTNGGLYYDADGNGSGSSAALLGNVGRGLALTYRDFYIV